MGGTPWCASTVTYLRTSGTCSLDLGSTVLVNPTYRTDHTPLALRSPSDHFSSDEMNIGWCRLNNGPARAVGARCPVDIAERRRRRRIRQSDEVPPRRACERIAAAHALGQYVSSRLPAPRRHHNPVRGPPRRRRNSSSVCAALLDGFTDHGRRDERDG